LKWIEYTFNSEIRADCPNRLHMYKWNTAIREYIYLKEGPSVVCKTSFHMWVSSILGVSILCVY